MKKGPEHKIIQFDSSKYEKEMLGILEEVLKKTQKRPGKRLSHKQLHKIITKFPKDGTHLFSRGQIISSYYDFVKQGKIEENQNLIAALQMKPIRTQSGVTPVTVLTKPFPCPGQCIFCPNDIRMPKSYLADEPGAMRALRNKFDPYLQAYNRLLAFQKTGHNIEKVELIILGGTWSFYPKYYQIWFVKRLYDALNDFGVKDNRDKIQVVNEFENAEHPGSEKTYNQLVQDVIGGKVDKFFKEYERATYEELEQSQIKNESALCRNVGLVIETRPDEITEEELIHIRRLGATKIQIGIQSLNDDVLKKNKRMHDSEQTAKAIELIRLGGFKIHGHWMANLHGSDPEKDIEDYKLLWTKQYCPDELKLYPCSIIPNTELSRLYRKGEFKPYTQEELLHVLTNTIPYTPRYTRLTRIVRDIPSTDIEAGNKITNFREVAEREIRKQGKQLEDIRSREIKQNEVQRDDLELEEIIYDTSVSTELFLSYKTKSTDKIVAFLRLSFPKEPYCSNNYFKELQGCAMIREVHVYGKVVGIGKTDQGKAQHLGLGSQLIKLAEEKSKQAKFRKLAVISAIGTRIYYRERGFIDDDLYLVKQL